MNGAFAPWMTSNEIYRVRGNLLTGLNLLRGRFRRLYQALCQRRLLSYVWTLTGMNQPPHELSHLYPRLSKGGVLIVDDYGYWEGCKKATDEFFSKEMHKPLLNRIDSLGIVAIKCTDALY
jgi:hypothetical protein